jgi:hypothetical protein
LRGLVGCLVGCGRTKASVPSSVLIQRRANRSIISTSIIIIIIALAITVGVEIVVKDAVLFLHEFFCFRVVASVTSIASIAVACDSTAPAPASSTAAFNLMESGECYFGITIVSFRHNPCTVVRKRCC